MQTGRLDAHIYSTQLTNADKQKIEFEANIVPALERGSKAYALELFVDKKLIGRMSYYDRGDCIYIYRMDNYTVNEEKNVNKIAHIGRLFIEHAMRLSLSLGRSGRVELDSMEYSSVAYFKMDMKKKSTAAKSLHDPLCALQAISEFTITMDSEKKNAFVKDTVERCFFSLFPKKDEEARKQFSGLIDNLISAKTVEDADQIKDKLLNIIEERIKTNEKHNYNKLLSTAAENMGTAKDKVTMKEAILHGTVSEDNKTFEKYLSEHASEKISAVDYMKTTTYFIPPNLIEKKIQELNINVNDPFPKKSNLSSSLGMFSKP